jgi:hypothetical protein
VVEEVAEEEVAEVEEVAEEEEGGWRWCRPPWPPPCRPFRNEPDRLVLLPLLPAPLLPAPPLLGLSEAVGVLDGAGEPVLGVLAGARLVVGVGSAVGS